MKCACSCKCNKAKGFTNLCEECLYGAVILELWTPVCGRQINSHDWDHLDAGRARTATCKKCKTSSRWILLVALNFKEKVLSKGGWRAFWITKGGFCEDLRHQIQG